MMTRVETAEDAGVAKEAYFALAWAESFPCNILANWDFLRAARLRWMVRLAAALSNCRDTILSSSRNSSAEPFFTRPRNFLISFLIAFLAARLCCRRLLL